jgi:hypothetical protein
MAEGHDLALPPPERQLAADPTATAVAAKDFPAIIVEHAAVAHHGTARGRTEDGSVRVHAVLKGHDEGETT